MIGQVRKGSRAFGPKAVRRIIELEAMSGLFPPEAVPMSVKTTATSFHRLENLDRAELKKALEDVKRLQERLEKLLGDL